MPHSAPKFTQVYIKNFHSVRKYNLFSFYRINTLSNNYNQSIVIIYNPFYPSVYFYFINIDQISMMRIVLNNLQLPEGQESKSQLQSFYNIPE